MDGRRIAEIAGRIAGKEGQSAKLPATRLMCVRGKIVGCEKKVQHWRAF
jgi:hypothetical protein